MLDRLIALFLIIILLPLLAVLSLLIIAVDGWPFWFVQKRVGKMGKIFWIWKLRTMKLGADKEQQKYRKLNEADGPVFKIHNDPRLTKVGKFLSHTGLDELPQLFNVIKGEMAIIGPRPLPVSEEAQIKDKFKEKRRLVRPGMISPWIVNGYHGIKFDDWMKSDVDYVAKESVTYNFRLIVKTIWVVSKLVLREIGVIT
jgi:lipopolysaccharide/colanic/teichoic acid biosynthesis glycosyltransferase